MKVLSDRPDEPGGIELDAGDRRAIDTMVREREEALTHEAIRDQAVADRIIEAAREVNEPLLATFAREVVSIIGANREALACLTSEERIDRIVYSVKRALRPLANVVAEGERDAIEARHIDNERYRECA